MREVYKECSHCNGLGKVKKHQYLKANKYNFECVCGEPMISEKHFDDIGEWHINETFKDKKELAVIN